MDELLYKELKSGAAAAKLNITDNEYSRMEGILEFIQSLKISFSTTDRNEYDRAWKHLSCNDLRDDTAHVSDTVSCLKRDEIDGTVKFFHSGS